MFEKPFKFGDFLANFFSSGIRASLGETFLITMFHGRAMMSDSCQREGARRAQAETCCPDQL
jgi:hypothetical protein